MKPLGHAQQLEAVLFAAGQPVTVGELAGLLDCAEEDVEMALDQLHDQLADRGLRLVRQGAEVGLVTAPAAAKLVERYLGEQARAELTKPALETLAIVAYRQPVSKSDIEAIRGVGSDQTLRNLLQRGLIAETAARPLPQFVTTLKLLQHLGLSRPEDLPPFDSPVDAGGSGPAAPSSEHED